MVTRGQGRSMLPMVKKAFVRWLLANKSQSFGIFRQPVRCSLEFYRTLTNILKKGFFFYASKF
jgi:hypothetical protein